MKYPMTLYFDLTFSELDDDGFEQEIQFIRDCFSTFKSVQEKHAKTVVTYPISTADKMAYAVRDFILCGSLEDACIHTQDKFHTRTRISPTALAEAIDKGSLTGILEDFEIKLAQIMRDKRGRSFDRHIIVDVPSGEKRKYWKYLKLLGYKDFREFFIQAMRTQFSLDIGRFVTGHELDGQVNNTILPVEDGETYDPTLWEKFFGPDDQ